MPLDEASPTFPAHSSPAHGELHFLYIPPERIFNRIVVGTRRNRFYDTQIHIFNIPPLSSGIFSLRPSRVYLRL